MNGAEESILEVSKHYVIKRVFLVLVSVYITKEMLKI